MLVSVVMAAYNEREYIDEILRRVAAAPVEKEVVVVDDCSTDGTREKLHELAAPSDDNSVFSSTTTTVGKEQRYAPDLLRCVATW